MSLRPSSSRQSSEAGVFFGDVSGKIQLLVADAGSRRAIHSMLDEHFEVIIAEEVVEADCYLVEDRLLATFKEDIVTKVNSARPAFCPLVIIQGMEGNLAPVIEADAEGQDHVLIDDVVRAPVDRSQLIRRVRSLLVRRFQSVELERRVREVEEQARELRRYQEAVESSANGILLLDQSGTIETTNPAFTEMSGYTNDDAVGQSPTFLQPTDAEPVFTQEFWNTLADTRHWDGEILIENKSGQRRVVNFALSPIGDEDNIEGFVMLMNDITERIQREQALADREAELDLLRQILTRYVRHNLRNGLTVIDGYAQLLARAELSETHQQWAETIVDTSRRLDRTSEKALTYSSLIDEDTPFSEYDVAEIVRQEVERLRKHTSGVAFAVDLPESCPIRAKSGIEQAICGLIENAVVHNNATSPAVSIKLEASTGITLIIEDNGAGIPESELAALRSGQETPLSHTQGIGLWLSKWVIEESGGDLRFEATESGTRVTVELPPGDNVVAGDLDIPSIKEREQRWEAVVNRMTDAVLEVDSEWTITFLDTRAEEILGVQAEAILGEYFWEEYGDTQGTRFEASYRKAMENRSTERITDYYEPLDMWLEVVAYPEFHGGISFYFRDVTAQKANEERLKRAQDRIEFALAATDATVWEWDFLTDSVVTIPAVHTGYENPMETMDDFFDGIHPDDRPHVQTALRAAIDAGTAYHTEYRVVSSEGVRWLEDHGEVRYEDGTPTEMIGIARDVTDRRDRERRYEAIFNQTFQFTGFMEPDGTLIEVNETALEFGGISHDEVIGKKIWDAHWFTISDATQAQTKEDVKKAAGGEFVRRELEVKGDGETAVIDFSIRPITDEDGTVRYLLPEGRDITPLKGRERELQERVKELTAIHRTRELFDRSDQQLTDLLREFVRLIPQSFQYPERTEARVTFNGEQLSTDGFEASSHTIDSSVSIREETALIVEVAVTDNHEIEELDPLPAEEQALLDTLVSIVRAELVERHHRERLEHLQDLLVTAEEIGDVGVWELEVETENLLWTEGTRRLHGVGEDYQPTLEKAIEFYHPEDRDMVSETVERALDTGDDFEFIARLRTTNDELRWVRAGGRVLDNGATLRGYVQDITEHRTVEEEVEASEERLRVALDAGDLGMWELDLQSEESPVRSFRHDEIFGYEEPVDEWSFERFLGHVHPDDREMVQSSFENAFEDGQWTFTCRIERVDGVERWITAHGLFFFDDADEPSHAIGIVEDVTEEKETEHELREKTERLEEFVRMVSHDIKNPLSVASGRLELYQERGDDDDLLAVAQALTRIEEVTTDLTALARFGDSELDSEPVSLEKTARAAWKMIDTRDAHLEVEECGIVADRSQLQGIFENLFKNAVGHGGSDVTVRVGGLTDGFYVEDTGTGIPADIRDKVFESGFTTGFSGSGIGLSIVSRIVAAHGWSIELTESAEGGARFEITSVETAE